MIGVPKSECALSVLSGRCPPTLFHLFLPPLFPLQALFTLQPLLPSSSSGFSSRPWRNLPPTWVIHMATRRPTHNTPIHMQEIHVDRRVVGWSAGRHVDHPCRGQISPWPARKVTDSTSPLSPPFDFRFSVLLNVRAFESWMSAPKCLFSFARISRA